MVIWTEVNGCGCCIWSRSNWARTLWVWAVIFLSGRWCAVCTGGFCIKRLNTLTEGKKGISWKQFQTGNPAGKGHQEYFKQIKTIVAIFALTQICWHWFSNVLRDVILSLWVMECSQKTESHHAGTQSPIMLGVTVGGAGVEITSARNVGIEHLYVIYVGSMLAIVFIGLKLLWGPSIQSFRHYSSSL